MNALKRQAFSGQASSRKIVFLDIDGTLSYGFGHVPRSARKVCRRARKNGHLLYIASGRAREQIGASILSTGFDGIICSGGAHIEIRGETVFREYFSPPIFEHIREFLDGRKAGYMIEVPGKTMVSPWYQSCFEEMIAPVKWMPQSIALRVFMRFLKKHTMSGNEHLDTGKIYKVVFIESAGLRFEDVEREFGGKCEIFRNSMPLRSRGGGEITPLGIHKGSALQWVRAFHGFNREDTIAFGDSDNDRTMLECAGTGVAMENGDEKLKACADDITAGVNRGGLAKAFLKYGLV
jgi:Cof subfamily protein (haloacid dehalogenase superfamily)